ncbi:Trans-aconitate 2-methyltransferase [Micromonospora sp. MW-13]|uniref:trans-aconitate 2-methyltransferase n=1 Tax=unclassified Micromonospora TaxID=2617518 RepID=UPI000E449C3C|nr:MULTISPECIES: trans-aconitate 2-methyltransferase [unclassified Micromonospora]MCX4473261.1 trans-aconitate 2-methyltransferase [Micromonospora sp. NBC_01655]RGC67305.1 Trans-aconitate 2-methyltransferase [Micromonospora sp. MW-13]
MWDPAAYLRYDDERGRAFHDLVARVRARRPRAVVDLGCGPGTLTATLAARWPGARVTGLDSSAEMIDRAAALGAPVDFAVGDVRDWRPAADVDVLVSNAVLQWVPEHRELLTRWAAGLPAGAWLAVGVPGNFDAPSHRALRAVAGEGPWAAELNPLVRGAPVDDAVGFATLLTGAGCAVDAWETVYVHLLPAPAEADHPVLTWMEGTALRPVRAALDAARWADFRTALGARLAAAYPVRRGQVSFPFRRVFVVARTGARIEENL